MTLYLVRSSVQERLGEPTDSTPIPDDDGAATAPDPNWCEAYRQSLILCPQEKTDAICAYALKWWEIRW